MQGSESNEDIYNNLPVDIFSNDYDEFETDSIASDENENYSYELLNEPVIEVTSSYESPLEGLSLIENSNVSSPNEEIEMDLGNFRKLDLETKTENKSNIKNEHLLTKNNSPIEDETCCMWIRCVRCGKKNEIDSNFCGKCGLQIHKTVSIEEPQEEETSNPEITRNIKYHYKRPVFCFGPRGKCFSSFSSPSKSVRNVTKFQLSALKEFHDDLIELNKRKVVAKNYPLNHGVSDLADQNWLQKDSILKDIAIMISSKSSFILDELLRNDLREYFARISPKDLGSIKMLATQDNVSYSRGEIDEIFHLLVIGNTMEACELCIKFNYWDHALIIAKTLDTNFYEAVMNRFLDSRFDNGHPLRILYLIMTNNEKSALEEIKNMINDREMPLFVQEIWTILINFLLRAKNESLVLARIFENIADCLFDRNMFENSLICYIISVLSGSINSNSDVLGKIDYLFSWFLQNNSIDAINVSVIPILNIFIDKMSSSNLNLKMWRCQFIRLIHVQFLNDIGCFDTNALDNLSSMVFYSKGLSDIGFASLFLEEISVIEARNYIEIKSEQTMSLQKNIETSSSGSSINVQNYSSEHASYNVLNEKNPNTGFSPVEFKFEDKATSNQLSEAVSNSNSDLAVDNFISSSKSSSPNHLKNDFILSKNTEGEIRSAALKSLNKSQLVTEKHDNRGSALFDKLKNWLPVKPKSSNQDNQKQVTKANMGKPNTLHYDEKLKKWVGANQPASEEVPKLPPPPTFITGSSASGNSPSNLNSAPNFRAKKGKVKYFDPLNPEGPSSSQLQPSVLNFD